MKVNQLLFPGLIGVLMLVSGCAQNSEQKQMQKEITELEGILYGDSIGMPDRNKALEVIQKYENYANAFPEDSLAPEYLYKGAEIAMNMQMSGRAIEYHQRIRTNYPNFDKVSYCLFLQAFIYENQMQQLDTAKKLYQEFIDTYPNHSLADDAQVSLDNMGKSIEELIQSWEKREEKNE